MISLSFANIKERNYAHAREKICQLISGEYNRHIYNQLDDDSTAIWSLLLAVGYLKAVHYEPYMTEYGDWVEVLSAVLTLENGRRGQNRSASITALCLA